MRSEPTVTPARRLLALVVCALLLGAASVGFDAATAHAATIGPQRVLRAPAGQYVVGTVFRGQPVVVKVHNKSRTWTRVVTDAGVRGRLRSSAVSKGASCH
jgi:hypothetical protein